LNRLVVAFVIAVVVCASRGSAGQSKTDPAPYTRNNTFTGFFEYSNDSSHIILGATPNRKLAGIGAQYERRLVENSYLRWSYVAEFRPFIVSSDPVANVTVTGTSNGVVSTPYTSSGETLECMAGTYTYSYTGQFGADSGTVVTMCSRQQTLAQGGSPIGFRINLLPRRPIQLTFSSNGGYMYSTKPMPIPDAGSFNFTFNFGGGLEYFYKPRRSIRLEYLVQHYSNHYTAPDNPGVDSGFARLAYAFGR
jgi:hypothetical protein